ISLERLDALRSGAVPGEPAGPAQRIGLSATVRPPEEVATFLGGARPVTIAAPPYVKQMELRIVVPVEDMTDPDPPPASLRPAAGAPGDGAPAGEPDLRDAAQGQRSIWPHVEEKVQPDGRSEEHTSELQSPYDLVCRLLLEKKKTMKIRSPTTEGRGNAGYGGLLWRGSGSVTGGQ